tara:strand:+ start:1433 stop:1630 length:198 start_codon:yes stop_codon:yes gene_type:complete
MPRSQFLSKINYLLNDPNVNIASGRSGYEKVIAQVKQRKSVDYSLGKAKAIKEAEPPTEANPISK